MPERYKILVMSCCHAQGEMRVCHLLLPNALECLHECCMGFVLGRKLKHGLAAGGDKGQFMCEKGAGRSF